MKQWQIDDTWQRAIRDRFLTPFYKRICVEGRFVYFQKSDCSTLIQKRLSVDTALQVKPDRSDCIEEKIVRQPWNSFFFETDSCTLPDKHSDGWMCYTQADALLYAFFCQQYLDTYIIRDFQEIKMWFWQIYQTFPEHTMPTDNRTRGRLVPIADVTEVAKVTHIHIYDNGEYESAMGLTRKEPRQVNTEVSLREGIERARTKLCYKPRVAIFNAAQAYDRHARYCRTCRSLMDDSNWDAAIEASKGGKPFQFEEVYLVRRPLCEEGKRLIDVLAKCTKVTYEGD